MKKLVLLLLVASLVACSQKPEASCNGDAEKSVVTSILDDALVKQITSDFANQGSNGNINVDSALIRATVEKIAISINDVLTTKSDPNSTKKFCSSTLKLAVPADIVIDADTARSMLSLNSSRQGALHAGIDFDANTVKSSLEYSVQPTDDGKKVYASTDSNNAALTFTATLIEQSLVKPALEKQRADQQQQQEQQALEAKQQQEQQTLKAQQQQEEVAQAQAAEQQAALQKAQADLKTANDAINVVWQAGTREWRQGLLPEQRLWLAQRENDCKIKALNSGAPDPVTFQTAALNCQVQMTNDRTQVLKAALQKSMQQPPVQPAAQQLPPVQPAVHLPPPVQQPAQLPGRSPFAQLGSYGARIASAVRPNLIYPDASLVPGNPAATFNVQLGPDGTILGKPQLVSSSGIPTWDEAVLLALEKTGKFPRNIDGSVPPILQIELRPKQ